MKLKRTMMATVALLSSMTWACTKSTPDSSALSPIVDSRPSPQPQDPQDPKEPPFSEPTSPLIGHWEFYKVIYKGQERPPFNPSLILTFDFRENGENTLRWERRGENGFCERKGRWNFTGAALEDEVIWVHPENNRDCSSDPDMRLGNKTTTRAEIHDGDFQLFFPVNEELLVYVFKRTGPPKEYPEDTSRSAQGLFSQRR